MPRDGFDVVGVAVDAGGKPARDGELSCESDHGDEAPRFTAKKRQPDG